MMRRDMNMPFLPAYSMVTRRMARWRVTGRRAATFVSTGVTTLYAAEQAAFAAGGEEISLVATWQGRPEVAIIYGTL